ncbi:MAG: hypothetical protein V1777_02720 [Candidatus Micrarchaeota archaeon]
MAKGSLKLRILLLIPILFSLVLSAYWLWLAASGRVCPQNLLFLLPFVAYLGLLGFPLVVLLVRLLVSKQAHLDFGEKQKEIAISFWVWLVLMLILAGFFATKGVIVLPGAEHLLCLK